MRKYHHLSWIAGLMLAFYMQTPSYAQTNPEPETTNTISNVNENGKRLWNLKDADIHTVINEVAKETGKNFVVSPQVNGKVTLISSYPLNPEELYQAFLALLEARGFSAIPSGPVIKIIPETFSKEENSKIINSANLQSSEDMSVTIARVKYISASELVKALKQLVYHFGYIESYTPTNDIIISDHASNIARILTLIHRLDRPSASTIEVIHLKHAKPDELVATLSTLLQQKGEDHTGLTLATDSRSNNILLHGGTPEQRLQVKTLLAELDVPLDKKSVNTEVIYLKYLRAEKVARILSGLIENYLAGKTGSQNKTSDESPSANAGKNTLINYTAGANQSSHSPSQNGESEQTTADFTNMNPREPNSGSIGPYVQWEEATNAVIISAPADLIQRMKSVIAKLDIRRPQVLIEAVIADISVNHAKELGIELNVGGRLALLTRFDTTLPLSDIGDDGNIANPNFNPGVSGSVGSGISLASFHGNQLRFLLRALQNDRESNILSTPNILTLDNEPAQIKVGSKVSFSTSQIQNNPTGGNPQNFFNREDVGLTLTINPQITPDGSIKLVIQQELSNLLPGTSHAGGNPDTSERFIHTTVMANNGEVLVLGGLLENDWSNVTSKVPLLGDIPGLGVLFRNNEKMLTKTNLMIFLRPTILYDDTDTVHIVGSKYEALRQAQLKTAAETTPGDGIVAPVLPTGDEKTNLPLPFEVS